MDKDAAVVALIAQQKIYEELRYQCGMFEEGSVKFVLMPGKYYIGDPCYVLSDDRDGEKRDVYLSLCDEFYRGPHTMRSNFAVYSPHPVYSYRPIIAGHTAYGDGGYTGSDNFCYSVDAGIIGIVPIELCARDEDYWKNLGTTFEATGLVTFTYEARGKFRIEYDDVVLTIDTVYEDLEDLEDEFEEENNIDIDQD